MLDEVPVAFVIPAPALGPTERASLPQQVITECKAKLADFEVLRAVFVSTKCRARRSRRFTRPSCAKACRLPARAGLPLGTSLPCSRRGKFGGLAGAGPRQVNPDSGPAFRFLATA
jgi:hypothetical protein